MNGKRARDLGNRNARSAGNLGQRPQLSATEAAARLHALKMRLRHAEKLAKLLQDCDGRRWLLQGRPSGRALQPRSPRLPITSFSSHRFSKARLKDPAKHRII